MTNNNKDNHITTVNGDTLKQLLAIKRIHNTAIAEQVGVSRFRISQITRAGSHGVRPDTAEKIAKVLGVTIKELNAPLNEQTLSEDEEAVLKMFRSLSPLDKAKVMIKIDEMMKQANLSQA